MFRNILVANRGECALRIIRACREMGISCVAVYSEADAGSPHVAQADRAFLIGPAPAPASYLNADHILEGACQAGANAVHPGWGFLAENAAFARRCGEAGLTFIGPPAGAIAAMGDKSQARKVMADAGVPVIPGSPGDVSDDEASRWADRIGYPVMVKASAGGGGIGMAVVRTGEQLAGALRMVRSRARRAFGDDALYIEKVIPSARHVEVQLAADGENVVAFPERECSVQRRHQKVLEETPSPAVRPDLRAALQETAVRAAEAIGYRNLGTVEFLLDPDGNFYFLEMNTRLQVEHGITELITGVDLVKEGIRLAAGEPLSFRQHEIETRGHALECRIYAEDAETFLPSPGRITRLVEPSGPGLRLDSGLVVGLEVTPFYDPMLARLMTWGETRGGAIERMIGGLESTVVEGISTNMPLHLRVLRDERFAHGIYTTDLLTRSPC